MAAPQKVLGLIGRFEQNADTYRSGQYNETQIRREFIDRQIDELVYALYGLTEEEIKIVEEATRG